MAQRISEDEGVFKFPAGPGFTYRLEYSDSGLSTANGDWLPSPEVLYCTAPSGSTGVANPVTLQFPIRLPVIPAGGGTPVVPPLPARFFTVWAYNDGTATVVFNGSLGEAECIFRPSLSFLSGGILKTGGVVLPYPANNPYARVDVFVLPGGASARSGWGGNASPSTPQDEAVLNMLTSSHSRILAALINPPVVPPLPPRPRFDERGMPDRIFYRVTENSTDSDHDGVTDDVELSNSLTPGFPGNATNPSRYDPGNGGIWDNFTDLVISEVMTNNDGARSFDLNPSTSGPLFEGNWVEILNPTDHPIATSVAPGTPVGAPGNNCYLTNHTGNFRQFMLPAATLPAGARMVILCTANPLPENPARWRCLGGENRKFRIERGRAVVGIPDPLRTGFRDRSGCPDSC